MRRLLDRLTALTERITKNPQAADAWRLHLDEGEGLLQSPERLTAMKAGLARVAERVGPPGASGRAAEAVLEAVAS